MKRLSQTTLVFAILFAVLIISPAVFHQRSGISFMEVGDVIDLLTPVILIPLYWTMFRVGQEKMPNRREMLFFLVLVALWVEGQGMHLSANSIGHLLKEMEGSDPYDLTYFYDEVLSHYIWHLGLVGLSALLIYRQWQFPFHSEQSALGLVSTAGIIHGLNFFMTIVEARTGPLGVPFAVAVTAFVLVKGRDKLRQQPLLAFFFVAYLLATILFAVWAIRWGGLPEFSEVGIID